MKLKKVLATILAAAMVLSTMSFSVFAEEADVWDGTSYSLDWLDAGDPEGTAGDEFHLNSAEDLAGLAYYVNNYVSTNHIFEGDTIYLEVDVDLDNCDWDPIGTAVPGEKNRFYGSFDGKGHTISNLKIADGHYYAGLFGQIPTYNYSQTFSNVTINNAKVVATDETESGKNKEAAGALIGRANGTIIENCHVTGEIDISGDRFVGGLLGHSYAQISDCTVEATGTIKATAWQAGGLVGSHGATATYTSSVENCSVIGDGEDGLNVTSYYASVGGAIGAVSVSGVDSTTMEGITVANVSIAADSEDYGSGIAYVAVGYEATNSTAGNVSATLGGEECVATDADVVGIAVALVGNSGYATLQEAIDAAKVNGDTVTLTTDLTIEAGNGGYSKAGIVQNGFDIDGNGHTLNVTGANDTWDCAIYTTGGTIKNLTIASGMRGVFTAGQTEDIILENVTIDGPIYTISADGASGVKWIIKNSTLNGWTSYASGFEVVSFENCTFGEGAGYAYMRPYADTTYIGCDFTDDYSVDARADVKMTDCTIDGTPMTAEDVAELLGGSAQANIGSVYYDSINDAFAAAVDGDTITLLADATPTLTSQRAITKASVIDLNGKTLTLTEDDLYFGTTTFKNGNIVVEPSVVASTAVFWMFENQTLTFDNVDITATGVTGTYLMGINAGTGSAINILNGTNIIIDNDAIAHLTAVICDNGTGNSVTIENSNIEVNNIEGRFYLGGSNGNVSVGNSTINLDGVKEGFYLRAGEELDIAGTSNVDVKLNDTNDRYGINLTDATANYTVADTATVNASIYKAPAPVGSNLAKKVKLSFEATDKQEVYNIYAEAVDGTINRLSAVQVKFALDNPRMSYTLAPATDLGVTLTNDLDDEEAYVFNFNGETAADATGAKLLIGTVTFGGYGNFNFTVDAGFNNKIKTAQTTDNIVEEYVPAPDAANEKQGTFDIASSAITGAAVVEAKRDVKVVIDFNNDITAGNDADYNDMTVTLTGSNGEVHTAQVGDLVNGQPNYTAEKAEMTFNVTAGYRYTVVVKGEGYRTARYSTNVDASDDTLVLTFWNNALENADRTERFDYIEEGVERSKKSVTFLAGDIAQDNIIDKYDLAAVVSYFGFDNLKTTNPNYVKYDLNRDGKIDADDISYVLVSWGK